jgi:hypothetical protein
VIGLDVPYGFDGLNAVLLFAYLVFALFCAEEFRSGHGGAAPCCCRCCSPTPAACSGSASCCARCGGPTHAEQSHYLRICMGHLRQKLKVDPAQPRHLLAETAGGPSADELEGSWGRKALARGLQIRLNRQPDSRVRCGSTP